MRREWRGRRVRREWRGRRVSRERGERGGKTESCWVTSLREQGRQHHGNHVCRTREGEKEKSEGKESRRRGEEKDGKEKNKEGDRGGMEDFSRRLNTRRGGDSRSFTHKEQDGGERRM